MSGAADTDAVHIALLGGPTLRGWETTTSFGVSAVRTSARRCQPRFAKGAERYLLRHHESEYLHEVTNDLVELLERQFAFLSGLAGRAFVRQTKRWLETLSGDPRLRQHLSDMEESAKALIRRHQIEDNESVAQLRSLVERIVIADPPFRTPTLSEADRAEQVETRLTFEQFDEVAAEVPRPVEPSDVEDGSRTAEMVPILDFQLNRLMYPGGTGTGVNSRPDLQSFYLELMTLHDKHRHAHNELLDEKLTHSGMALLELRRAFHQLNPAPSPTMTGQDTSDRWLDEQLAEVTGVASIREDLYSARHGFDIPESTRQQLSVIPGKLEGFVEKLRAMVRRIHEGLVVRVGTRRSLLALVHRFKERCEWHDRDRLRDIAAQARAVRRKPEDALAAELARWLFDQGFSPLTEPKVGGLMPDLLDPARLYVEAKRYKAGDSGHDVIRKGAKQVYSTVQRLRGTQYSIEEALFVVFRESGPLYLLPEAVPCGGWVMLPVLIDIAPPTETGRRERHLPITISAEALGPQAQGETPRATRPGRTRPRSQGRRPR